jgi:hypothetical protein
LEGTDKNLRKSGLPMMRANPLFQLFNSSVSLSVNTQSFTPMKADFACDRLEELVVGDFVTCLVPF